MKLIAKELLNEQLWDRIEIQTFDRLWRIVTKCVHYEDGLQITFWGGRKMAVVPMEQLFEFKMKQETE